MLSSSVGLTSALARSFRLRRIHADFLGDRERALSAAPTAKLLVEFEVFLAAGLGRIRTATATCVAAAAFPSTGNS
jgi:hypothetical protein